ncbi:MAG: peroxiredoxin, partial [Chloroflexota bacterium]
PGTPAPDFALPDDTGATRSLAAERGQWVVLFFYPKDDTPGCTIEACQFRDGYADFRADGAEVWGISILDSASKAAFKEKHGLTFPLLADAEHAVAEAYGVWREKSMYGKTYMGVARATFLVDPDGRIARTWDPVTPDGHAAEVRAALAELRGA